ncbi:hypothetical protein BLNAU_24485 [Blattamonas nauphoetae]|uniref:Polymorphic outer membrane protein n=1 Tax=Blattamonas nauphoetae TaxID=2049346 RepID=A0ABQ9WMA8_9EUKA|nr:hypothetical protein BLNAU_24485 [Blattamonas nauphoetae]
MFGLESFVVHTEFVFDAESNVAPSLTTTDTFSSKVSFSHCEIGNVVVGSESSLVASTLVQYTLMDSCVLQNVTHINHYRRSEGVIEPFNVSLTNSRWIDCSNGFYGSIVRDVEDQTTFRAVNNTFLRGVTNGETTGDTFTGRKEAVNVITDHSYVSCNFTSCTAFNTAGGALRCRGALHFNGNSKGSLQITTSLFEHNLANIGGSVSSQFAGAFLFQLSNITNGTCIIYSNSVLSFGGGLMVAYLPSGAIVTNLRFDACNSNGSGGSIDCSNMTGSITFSNIFIANKRNANNEPFPNDIRFDNNEPWLTLLKYKSTFVNCFSTSKAPKVILSQTPHALTFEYYDSNNKTELDIHLPKPAIIVHSTEGNDVDGCGRITATHVAPLHSAGINRVAQTSGEVLIEAGHYEETTAFDPTTKSAKFTSFGDISPVVSYSGESTPFITKGQGRSNLCIFVYSIAVVASSFSKTEMEDWSLQTARSSLRMMRMWRCRLQ